MNRHDPSGRLRLGVAGLAIVGIWTLLLPWIASQPAVRQRIDFLDRQGIDPAALYYTDLERMEQVESQITAIRQAHPEAFWRPSKRGSSNSHD